VAEGRVAEDQFGVGIVQGQDQGESGED